MREPLRAYSTNSLKVDSLAKASRWAELDVPDSNFLELNRLAEAPFATEFCLISGLESHRMPRANEQQRQSAVEDLCKVVIGDGMTQMTVEDSRKLASGAVEPDKAEKLRLGQIEIRQTLLHGIP